MRDRLSTEPARKRQKKDEKAAPYSSFDDSEELGKGNPEDRYQMSHSKRNPINLSIWLGTNEDPALKVSSLHALPLVYL
jgi:hypothetical protein